MRRLWNGSPKQPSSPSPLGTWPRARLGLEELELRNLLAGYSPTQLLQAYGFNQLGLAQPGLGETIAIVEAYQQPAIQTDVAAFDARFNLPALNLTVLNDGASQPDPTGGWQGETALDVEWAHAIAPYAHIVLVEAADDNLNTAGVPTALLHAVSVAASQPHVAVVSMSWGVDEFSTETQYDNTFRTPGVTFVASSGDTGAPVSWPAVAPNVVAVGGTTLQLSSSGTYLSETGWAHRFHAALGASGGGISQYEAEPSYQQGDYVSSVTRAQNPSSKRLSPDVAYDGDPNTGVAVYDSTNGGWTVVGGTSAGAPQWAALVALADQVRAAANPAQPALSSFETLTALYQAQGDFHDITSGNNGYPAGVGYDLVTGLGTPEANLLVPALAAARTTESFVIGVYQRLLGRTPDAGGLAYWQNLLEQGMNRSAIVLQIEQTPEYLTNLVAALYQKLLHRQADPAGLSAFTSRLADGGTVEQVEAILVGSPEYFQTRAGGQIGGFLNALYMDALNRIVDPAGQTAFGQTLSQGGSRQAVAAAVFGSAEYRQDLVESYYQSYLGRPADSGGLAAFVTALGQGTSDQEVIAAILGSGEYWGN